MLSSLQHRVAAELLHAWLGGEPHAGLVLADDLEERGNEDDLPLAGLRWLAEIGKTPFEDHSLGRLPNSEGWRSQADDRRTHSAKVWTWLWSDDPWGLPFDVIRGIAAPYRPYEWDEEIRYNLHADLIAPYGDPEAVALSRTLRIVEVASFPLALIVAALGHEVRAGLREGAPPAPPRSTVYD